MRIATALLARGNPKEPVPFQELLPLKLKSQVSGKGEKSSEICCIYEMSVMFACFKEHEFNQSLCSKEIENFKKCYTHSLTNKNIRKERDAKGILIPGDKKMSHKQINMMLRMFPNER